MKKLTSEEIETNLKQLNNWSHVGNALVRNFIFNDFKETIGIMVKIGEVAEELNHHPEWSNVYNKLNIRLTTHDAGGITSKDMELASRIDSIT